MIQVRVTTLDDEIKEDVYILKVDVQGWEPHVFAGAINLLSKRKVTVIGAPAAQHHPRVPVQSWPARTADARLTLRCRWCSVGARPGV